MTTTKNLAKFIKIFDMSKIPASVIEHAKLCIADATGVALAASTFNFSDVILNTFIDIGDSGGERVFGKSNRLSLRDAIFVNASLVHGLDFDDTQTKSVMHCSSSIWPLAFNLGTKLGKSGPDILRAFILSSEIAARLGIGANGKLQSAGFHPTGIFGAFGCAVASSILLDLTADETANALGIVISLASGNMEFVNDGAWNKRIHPAWAAVAGLTSSFLSKNKFSGTKRPIEGTYGIFRTHLPNIDANFDAITRNIGEKWEFLETALKPFPACHFNHAFAECALALSKEHGFNTSEIKKVTAGVHSDQVNIVCEPLADKQRPENSYSAQFSIPFIVAATLMRSRFTLRELESTALKDPKILNLAQKVSYDIDATSLYPQNYSGKLNVLLKTGETLETFIAAPKGSKENPMTELEIKEKFITNASLAKSKIICSQAFNLITNLDSLKNMAPLHEALWF